MLKALALVLTLTIVQDDPHVTYREGLFEEVDQGNLEKAAELYAKVLKSNAPDALKAKALLRTGFCLEKKGKKKEAEQAWRDVVERFPAAADTAKLARERLSALAQPEGPGLSLDTQVQGLILDLGSDDDKTRGEAIRKLVLLSDSVIPEVRRALKHRDARLSAGAALALVRMNQVEGVYEALKPNWFSKPAPATSSLSALCELLVVNEGARALFLKDVGQLPPRYGLSYMAYRLMSIPDPDFRKLVEDWIVDEPEPGNTVEVGFRPWVELANETEFARLVQRLSGSGAEGFAKMDLLFQFRSSIKPALTSSPTVRKAVLDAFERWPDPSPLILTHQQHLALWTFRFVNPNDLAKGPLRTWFKRGSQGLRHRIIDFAAEKARQQGGEEFNRFLMDQLGSPDVPTEMKNYIYSRNPTPRTPEELQKLVSFGLEYIRENLGKPDEGRPLMFSIIGRLLEILPDDSKELPAVLDACFDCLWEYDHVPPKDRAQARRGALVAASLRAIHRKSKGNKLALRTLEPLGEPADKVRIGPALSTWPRDPKNQDSGLQFAVAVYCDGVLDLPEADREAHWKGLREIYAQGDPELQIDFLIGCSGRRDSRVDALMTEAAASPSEDFRITAVRHWQFREGYVAIPALMRALDDRDEEIRVIAIESLGQMRAFEAVPKLILYLEDSSETVRSNALEALKLIRKHYEERSQWQRWYDETKKALDK